MQQLEAEAAASLLAKDISTRSRRRRVEGGYLFLVGAGASRSAGIPLAKTIAGDLKRRLARQGVPFRSEDVPNDVSEYQAVMSKFAPDEQVRIVRRYIQKAKSRDGKWKLNHFYLVLAEIYRNYPTYPRTLLTTNFDPLLQEALSERGLDTKSIKHYQEIDSMSPFETSDFPSVVHLHGYWQNHFLYNSLREWTTYRENWRARLVSSLLPFGLVMIGYSGHPDDIVMQTLSAVRQGSGQLAGDILWCRKAGTRMSYEVRSALEALGNVREVIIEDADSFMLRLGEALELPEVLKLSTLAEVIRGQSPSLVREYRNHANVEFDFGQGPKRSMSLRIRTDPTHELAGENYAGIDIFATTRLFDLSKYSQMILQYDARLIELGRGGERVFEIKLESAEAGHIETVRLGRNQDVSMSLKLFSDDGVDLGAVEHIVIGAQCEHIGLGATLELNLKRIAFL